MANITGTELNDTLNDGPGDDLISGLGGDDTILVFRDPFAVPQVDSIDGGTGSDTVRLFGFGQGPYLIDLTDGGGGRVIGAGISLQSIERVIFTGGAGVDVVVGGSLDDRLEGGRGSDRLNGGQGDDVIVKFHDEFDPAEADVLNGSSGIDTLEITLFAAPLFPVGNPALTLDISDGGGARNIGDGTRLANFERIVGSFSGFNANVTGGALGDEISTGSTNDVVHGGGGDDIIRVGTGVNSAFGEDGDDALSGRADSFFVSQAQIYDGGAGSDLLTYENNSSNVVIDLTAGGGGTDIGSGARLTSIERINYTGGTGNETITGGALADEISTVTGQDSISGMGGDDRITVGVESEFDLVPDPLADRIDGGAGTDFLALHRYNSTFALTLNISNGGGGTNIGDGSTVAGIERLEMVCGTRSDRITGGALDDVIYGYRGHDRLTGGAGFDTLDGGEHNDTLDGGDGTDNLAGGAGDDILRGGAGDDLLVDDRSGSMFGGDGADAMNALCVYDPVAPSVINTIDGGTGIDHLQISWVIASIFDPLIPVDFAVDISDGGGGRDIGNGTSIANVERLIFRAGSGDDRLTGGALADSLSGITGHDVLRGMGGDDTLSANGAAADAPDGGDVIEGGTGVDTLFLGSRVQVTIDVSRGGLGADIGDGTTISGVEILNFRGGDFDDIVTGGAFDDELNGAGGNDILSGGAGADDLWGDDLSGANGIDRVSYYHSAGVAISIDGSLAQTGDAFGDYLISIERLTGSRAGADHLRGNLFTNHLSGAGGGDMLEGMAGNDVLLGGTGADTLSGGAGRDTFDYTGLNHGGDTILDFANAPGNDDQFRFSGAVFGGLPAGALDSSRFSTGTSGLATSGEQRFIYETDAGILRFDADGNGGGAAYVIANLTGAPVLGAGDFVIV